MKATIGSLIVAGIALTGWAGTSQAAPVVADFAAGAGDIVGAIPSLTLDLGGGLEVTVTAATHSSGVSGDAPFPQGSLTETFVFRAFDGLGVQSPGSGFDDLDSFGDPELLRFTFNQPVTLLSVIFERATANDEFDMAVDDVDVDVVALLGSDDMQALPIGDFGIGSRLADFTGDDLTGTEFQFYTTDFNDVYRIRQFLVEAAADEGDGADVPAPPALLLLGMGLAGLGFARRYRR